MMKPDLSPRIPRDPIFEASHGATWDMMHGMRVHLPSSGSWRCVIVDASTGLTLIDQRIEEKIADIETKQKYYVPYQLQLYRDDEMVYLHTMDLTGQTVLVWCVTRTIGDTMAWFPYIEKFGQEHNCKMVAALHEMFIPLFEKQYPDIQFVTLDEAAKVTPYASYYLGVWWDDERDMQPIDHRLVGLHKTAAYILGLDQQEEIPPRLDLSAPRKIKEPYVCIAVQSSCMAKNWTPDGWYHVVRYLKDAGYRVLCIDKEPVTTNGCGVNMAIPNGAEDWTGDHPLQERIDIIKDADMFIGLASGLSWVAWACKVPVIMIAGFSLPFTEFYTPYRVQNFMACNGCWNDVRHTFDHSDWTWCPRHKGTPRQFECMRLITAKQVIETIKRIPAFQERMGK